MTVTVSEKTIEDILSIDKSILSDILHLTYADLSLLARQKQVSSGIIDLLYLHKDELILIELKAVPFYKEVIGQIEAYYDDLILLQSQNKLISASIRKVVLVTGGTKEDESQCLKNGIILQIYDPTDVLARYYENFKNFSDFLRLQSGDYGVSRLGLLGLSLKHLGNGMSLERIAKAEGRSLKTIRNRISLARLLSLVSIHKGNFYLTELGEVFTAHNSPFENTLSDEQRALLATFVRENPYYSQISYTILSLVEAVFVLSKNSYPVPKHVVQDYFVKSVGKTTTWQAKKSRETATYIFSNYCLELDFLARINNEFFITPAGIHAILLLQLNRSIKLIESRK